jgi:hypothetical protein
VPVGETAEDEDMPPLVGAPYQSKVGIITVDQSGLRYLISTAYKVAFETLLSSCLAITIQSHWLFIRIAVLSIVGLPTWNVCRADQRSALFKLFGLANQESELLDYITRPSNGAYGRIRTL